MRRSLLLIVSVAVNLLLLAAVLSPRRAAVSEAPAPMLSPSSANTADSLNNVVVRRQFFSWGEVESPDYRTYIGRLREIGCPEQTIRDIVVADVNQLYARKRLEDIPTAEEEWWRSDPDTNLLQAAHARNVALEQEKRTLLDTLLGANWQVADTTAESVALNGAVLGDLSDDVKKAVRDIVSRGQKQMLALATTNGPPTRADLVRVEQQVRADLAKVLTPAQLEEFVLRYSSTAADLRSQLHGFEVTPEQFRKMFDLRDPIEQQLALTSPANLPPVTRDGLIHQLDGAIKSVLGADQYAAFLQSSDPDYRAAAAIAASNNAPSNLVDKLYQVKLLTRQEEDRINNDPTLTADQKAAQIADVEQQAQSYSDQLMGIAPPAPPVPAVTPPLTPAITIHPYARGETIDSLGAQYGVSALSILGANPDIDLNRLAPGTPIKIPVRPPPPSQ